MSCGIFHYSVQNRSLWNFQCHSLEELVPLTQIISVGYIHSHKSIQEEQNSKPRDSSLPTNLQCGTVSKAFNRLSGTLPIFMQTHPQL